VKQLAIISALLLSLCGCLSIGSWQGFSDGPYYFDISYKTLYGFEIDSASSFWSGSYSLSYKDIKLDQQVNHVNYSIFRYVGNHSIPWKLSLNISEGAVRVYEVVADDYQGLNVRKLNDGVWANRPNPMFSLIHRGGQFP
jgi:hypothetical protein